MNTKLKAVVNPIDFYQATYPEDACVLIFDNEKVISYKRWKQVDLKINVGETVEMHKNTTNVRAMKSGKFLREERGAELSGAVQQMSATTEELAHTSTDVAKSIEDLSKFTDTMNNDIQQINAIVNAVKGIASKSKILGLNASIEAARSGIHGKGFAIVANKIHKMAQNSTESAESITKELENIKKDISYVNESTMQSASYMSINRVGDKLMELSEIDK